MRFTARRLVYVSVAFIASGAVLMLLGGLLISGEYGVSGGYIAANLGTFCGFGPPLIQLFSIGNYTAEVYTYPPLPTTGGETTLNLIVKDEAGRYAEGFRYSLRVIETALINDARVDIIPIHESGEYLCKYGSCVYRYSFKNDGVYRLVLDFTPISEPYSVSFYITVYRDHYLAMFPLGLYLVMAGIISAVIAVVSRLLS